MTPITMTNIGVEGKSCQKFVSVSKIELILGKIVKKFQNSWNSVGSWGKICSSVLPKENNFGIFLLFLKN